VRFNDALLDHVERGLFPPYAEKTRAGLDVFDCRGEPLYGFRYPWRGYARFEDVPPIVAQALLFIENRDLLDESRPTLNPAVDWVRFARAALGQLGRMVNMDLDAPGGSTLATQIEKYRHSPGGITLDAREKLRQMVSASVRAYRDGEQTLPVRRRLVLDYLNTVPLSAAPGHGEVNGLGDGLWVWFGADFERVNALLSAPEGEGDDAHRPGPGAAPGGGADDRPPPPLVVSRRRARGAGAHHRRLPAPARRGRPDQRRAARRRARPAARLPRPRRRSGLGAGHPGKGTTAVRTRLAGMLDTSLYSLDRLDAELGTTLHGGLQQAVGDYLGRLADPAFARSQGLIGERMLQPATLGAVRYSFTLVERTARRQPRARADRHHRPAARHQRGQQARARLHRQAARAATYLEIVAELHGRLAALDPAGAAPVEVDGQDRLTRWAIDHLATTPDRSLPAMLEAALERRFSASPGEGFFTGGGRHTFGNFNASDNAREPTLREALQASINLPFVRLMREIVRHTMYQVPGSTARLLEDNDDPRRVEYLARFADREGQALPAPLLAQVPGQHAGGDALDLLDGLRPGADRLAAVFRYLEPEAPPQRSPTSSPAAWASRLSEARIAQLYARNAPEAFDLPDRGYVARVHPLELWLVAFRLQHPEATLADAVAASAEGAPAGVPLAVPHPRQGRAGFAHLHPARGRGLPRHPPPLGAAGLSLRPPRALAGHRARQLGRPSGGARRADGHHRQRRPRLPTQRIDTPALRARHALRDRVCDPPAGGRAGDGARGGARRCAGRCRTWSRAAPRAGWRVPSSSPTAASWRSAARPAPATTASWCAGAPAWRSTAPPPSCSTSARATSARSPPT
jgi:membrane peptidoglycan carboxypeptidase